MLGCLHRSLCLSFGSCLNSIISWGLIIQQPHYLTLLYLFTLFSIFTALQSTFLRDTVSDILYIALIYFLSHLSTYMLHKAWFLHILFTSVSPAPITMLPKLQTFNKYFLNWWMNDVVFARCSISSRLK